MKKKTEAKTDVQHQEEFEIGKLIAGYFFAAVREESSDMISMLRSSPALEGQTEQPPIVSERLKFRICLVIAPSIP